MKYLLCTLNEEGADSMAGELAAKSTASADRFLTHIT